MHGAGNVGADGTPEPPFSRVHFSTKSLKLRIGPSNDGFNRMAQMSHPHDALRVDIHAFSMMSVLVRHRSTISDIVSFESMACSFRLCSRSAGSLN